MLVYVLTSVVYFLMASAEATIGSAGKSVNDVVNDLSLALAWTVDDWALVRKRALKSVADHIGVTNNDDVAHLLRLSGYTLQFLALEHLILNREAGEGAVALMLTCKSIYSSLSSAQHVWRPLLQRLANSGWFFAQQSPAAYYFAKTLKWDLRNGTSLREYDEDWFDRQEHGPIKAITAGYMKKANACTCEREWCSHSDVVGSMRALNKKKVRVRVRRALKLISLQQQLFEGEENFHDVYNWPRVPDTTASYSTLVKRYTPAHDEQMGTVLFEWSGRCEKFISSYNGRMLDRILRPSDITMYVLRLSFSIICGSLFYDNHWELFKPMCYNVMDGDGPETRKMFLWRFAEPRSQILLSSPFVCDESYGHLPRSISKWLTEWCVPNSVHVLEANGYMFFDDRYPGSRKYGFESDRDTW